MKTAEDIAIIGWQVRFPGADTVEDFWQNLRNGVESIRRSTEAQLLEAGYAAEVVGSPNWVPAAPVIDDVELFDAAFFGFSPRDAEIVDPQIRIFIETAWSALEDAGYDADRFRGRVGVFAGANISRYYLDSLKPLIEQSPHSAASTVMTLCFNDKDALSTLVSYKLNLRGPAVTVQTFCSTSLVAVHMGCQSLQLGESDMVIAGGSNLHARSASGYEYREGDILSPDGHCRPFDEQGRGTLFGSGAGAVVLKRLEEAIRDGDTIHAVIKGSAVNNDGSLKAGYTAPSIEGQSAAVARALEVSGVDPRTIGFVEAHGTATEVGDPIEVAALTRAYAAKTDAVQYCALGSVKSNLGHLDRAAGMSSLVKAALAVERGQIPPTVNFRVPNPRIDFAGSPFFVNGSLLDWKTDGGPRRAGVSGLGFGGTNAHVIIEQAPPTGAPAASRRQQLLVLSTRTPTALTTAAERLAKHLQTHPEQSLADVAHTLRQGRRAFPYRQAVVAASTEEAISALEAGGTGTIVGDDMVSARREVVFLFPGQGAQYPGMGRGLYETEPVFRATVDECAELLREPLGLDLRDVLYPATDDEAAAERLKQTALTQPALFVVEYATAQLLGTWGLKPQGMIGHSVGEYVAACLSGVLGLQDALALVALRGRLMQACAPGAMLAVMADEAVALRHAGAGVSLAAVNAPGLCVLAGPFDAVDAAAAALRAAGVESRRLETSHAFHSAMMEPALEEFASAAGRVTLQPPTIPYVSNLTGTWIEASQATDPSYWVRHLREAVRFADGLRTVAAGTAALVEVGPGRTLGTFAKRAGLADDRPVLATLRPARESVDDLAFLFRAVAGAWVSGVEVDWDGFGADESRRRVPLPTYPFERARFWLQPERRPAAAAALPSGKQGDVADWFATPAWKPSAVPQTDLAARVDGRPWLLVGDDTPFLRDLATRLAELHQPVVRALFGAGWLRDDDGTCHVSPGRAEDFAALFADLQERGLAPGFVVHTGALVPAEAAPAVLDDLDDVQDRVFYSPLFLLQELGRRRQSKPVRVAVVSNALHSVVGDAVLRPERATLLGPCRVGLRESADLQTCNIDLAADGADAPRAVDRVLAEVIEGTGSVVAYRGDARWVPTFESTRLAPASPATVPLKAGGVYLVTGGTGGIGLAIAEDLTRRLKARVVLVSRTGLPEPEGWDGWLAGHDAADPTSRRIQQVRAMQAAGGEVLVRKADVASLDDMSRVIDEIDRRFGRLDGVFHTAGVPGGGVIQLKKRDVAARVLDPKVRGTLVLDALVRGRGLDFVVLFSSVAAVAGPLGQVDYCGANSFLDAFATQRNGEGGTLWTSVGWDDWAEVGMAVETSHRLGVENAGVVAAASEELQHPHFCRRERTPGEVRYVARLREAESWLLSEHRLFGEPTVPGSAFLEYVRAAFEAETGQASCEMKNIFLARPLSVSGGETREMAVVLRGTDPGSFEFAVESRGSSTNGEVQKHVQGQVRPYAGSERRYDVAELEEACPEHPLDQTFLRPAILDRPGQALRLGERWTNVTRVQYGPRKVLGFHELAPEHRADVEAFKLHPAFTDFTALYPLYVTPIDVQYVPVSYTSVRVSGPLPARVVSYVDVKDDNVDRPMTLRFDCRFLDESGRELLEIEALTLHRMDGLPRTPASEAPAVTTVGDTESFTVGIGTPGVLETLAPRPTPRRPPGPGEVEIQVAASGLNFRDVLRALGMLAAEHDAGEGVVGFGAECAGKVAAVGAGVTEFAPGDDVLAFATRSFSGYVTTSARAVARIPEGMGFVEAASIPMVFLTAHHALARLARVEAGERVLIHAAAGGVGLAALQVARHLGAEVYASVGSPEKRAYLESLGVRHITTSRNLSFADEIRGWTGGEGVDVVLNALAGDFITTGVGLLRPGGRFVEIGARDIYADMPLGLRPFARSLTFSAFDLGQVAAARPEYLRTMLREVLDLFERGVFQPLPIETYPAAAAADAFRHMAAARHIGKIVISVADLPRQAAAAAPSATPKVSVSGRDLSHAILPHEGVDALHRALAARRPHLVVTTRRLQDLTGAARTSSEMAAAPAAKPAHATRKLHPRPGLTTPFREPGSPEEQTLAKLWRELLGLDRVGVNDSFFELGGDSLLGIQLIALIKTQNPQYADTITPASLYEGPTVAELARKLAGTSAEPVAVGTTTLTPEERRAKREQRRGRGTA